MSLFAIADTHLSFGTDKPMNVFGGWQDYEKRLEKNLSDARQKMVEQKKICIVMGVISGMMTGICLL